VNLLITVITCKTNARSIECQFSISVWSNSKLRQQRLSHQQKLKKKQK